MTPEEKKLLIETSNEVKVLSRTLNNFLEVYYRTNFPDKMVMTKELVINNKLTLPKGSSLDMSQTSQIKVGGAGSTIGFFGATPVVKQGAITSPTVPSATYVQAEATSMKNAIDAIRNVLINLGFTS